jgi:hypothetical protein
MAGSLADLIHIYNTEERVLDFFAFPGNYLYGHVLHSLPDESQSQLLELP